jgi:hypothetical protein
MKQLKKGVNSDQKKVLLHWLQWMISLSSLQSQLTPKSVEAYNACWFLGMARPACSISSKMHWCHAESSNSTIFKYFYATEQQFVFCLKSSGAVRS